MSFVLDPRLAADAHVIGDLPLSRALLMNDARFPWVILVPRREGVVELMDLDVSARALLIEEMAQTAEALKSLPGVEKINIGALGNIVRQFHAHVVGRRTIDAAWPGPVWGAGSAKAYDAADLDAQTAWLKDRLNAKAV